jgi:hypothetical protein
MESIMIRQVAAAVLAIGIAGPVSADPWKDESGKGRWRGGGYDQRMYGGDWDRPRDRKMKYRTADGCEVERKWKRGEYEHKVKCKNRGQRYGSYD